MYELRRRRDGVGQNDDSHHLLVACLHTGAYVGAGSFLNYSWELHFGGHRGYKRCTNVTNHKGPLKVLVCLLFDHVQCVRLVSCLSLRRLLHNVPVISICGRKNQYLHLQIWRLFALWETAWH